MSVGEAVVSAGRERALLPPPSELALAAVVTAVMAADLHSSASVGLGLLAVVPAGMSLAWRLRIPELPVVLIGLANALVVGTAPGEFGPQTVVLGLLVGVFTAAQQLSGRRALLAAAGSLLVVWTGHVASRDGDAADFFPFVSWAVPWLAGRLVRRAALAAREAGARAALLEVEAREATSRERDRIARELHDVVAHAVSLMVVQAGAERMALQGSAPRTAGVLEAIEVAGRQALTELRAMLGVLRVQPAGHDGLAPQPGLGELDVLVDAVRGAGLVVDLDVVGDVATVGPGPSLAAYRVVQESLTNAVRHGAGPAAVRVVVQRGELLVEASNRRGPAGPAADGSGRGLLGMRERVEAFGGSLLAGPDGDVWRVSASLPLAPGRSG